MKIDFIKFKELNEEISKLEDEVAEANIRLKALKYKEMQKNNGNNNGIDKVSELLNKIEQEANKW